MHAGHAALANASTKGRQVMVEQSSHATMHLQDEVIADAIRQMVTAVQ